MLRAYALNPVYILSTLIFLVILLFLIIRFLSTLNPVVTMVLGVLGLLGLSFYVKKLLNWLEKVFWSTKTKVLFLPRLPGRMSNAGFGK
jgi:hypothetical protein